MRSIVRRLGRDLRDPASVVSVIAGVLVGAFLGGHPESRTPVHTTPVRNSGLHTENGTISTR